MQHATGAQLGVHQRHPVRLHDAPFVVLFLVPGVGEIELQPVQGAVRDAQLEDVHGVVAVGAQVAQAALLDFQQQGADTGPVHLDADKVLVRFRFRHPGQGLAHAVADFQHPGRVAPEFRPRIQHALGPFQTIAGPECVQRLALAMGEPAFAQHEAAYPAHHLAGFRVFVLV